MLLTCSLPVSMLHRKKVEVCLCVPTKLLVSSTEKTEALENIGVN